MITVLKPKFVKKREFIKNVLISEWDINMMSGTKKKTNF